MHVDPGVWVGIGAIAALIIGGLVVATRNAGARLFAVDITYYDGHEKLYGEVRQLPSLAEADRLVRIELEEQATSRQLRVATPVRRAPRNDGSIELEIVYFDYGRPTRLWAVISVH